MFDSYRASGFGLGMAKFIALVSEQGEFGPDYADRPDPDPAAFGMPTVDDGSRNDPLMNNMITIPVWAPDRDALRAIRCRVVLAVGEESGETLAARAPRAIAAQGGGELVVFPGDHIGFAGGEYGQTGSRRSSRPGCARFSAPRLSEPPPRGGADWSVRSDGAGEEEAVGQTEVH